MSNKRNHEEIGVPGDVLDLVSQKSNSKVAKKDRIINEEHVDQDIVDAMIDVTDRADLRKILNIENERELEFRWYLEYDEDDENDSGNYWLDAVVTNSDTGRNHKFIDEDDEDEFTYAPIVEIKYTSGPDKDDTKEICFLSDHLVYDVEEDCVILWRNKGDDFDDSEDEDENDVKTEFLFMFSDHDQLEKAVNDFVPKIFINVLKNFKTQYEMLPFNVRREWDAHIVIMKDLIVKKIIEFFKNGSKDKPGTILTLGQKDITKIIDECMEEIN